MIVPPTCKLNSSSLTCVEELHLARQGRRLQSKTWGKADEEWEIFSDLCAQRRAMMSRTNIPHFEMFSNNDCNTRLWNDRFCLKPTSSITYNFHKCVQSISKSFMYAFLLQICDACMNFLRKEKERWGDEFGTKCKISLKRLLPHFLPRPVSTCWSARLFPEDCLAVKKLTRCDVKMTKYTGLLVCLKVVFGFQISDT